MTSYILRRLAQTIVVLIALSFVTYAMMGLMPGDPLDIACQSNPDCTSENLEQMKKSLGLDRPVAERYLSWLGSVVQGDLGYSRIYRQPVAAILMPRLLNTLLLGAVVLVFSAVVAIPLGVLTSLRKNTKFDYTINFLAFLGVSAPAFWLGLVLMIVFSVWLQWLPAGGVESVGLNGSGGWLLSVIDRLKYLILPALTLSSLTIAGWIRFTRSSMLETMRMDYIRTARAKGLPWRQVVVHHGLRNALLPVVTVIALECPRLVSGALITETVFAYQGIGKLMYDSVIGNDFNVAMCSFVITCFMVLLMSLVADVLYAVLDPRVSLS